MNDHSLPTQDSDHEVSDHGSEYNDDGFFPYVIRLTPLEKYTRDDVRSWLKEKFPADCWVMSQETKPKLHFHIVLVTDVEDPRVFLREFLFKYWPAVERTRGWGNKQYNCQWSTDQDQAVSYCVKDGDYEYNAFSDDYIKERLEASHAKTTTANFASEFEELETKFQDNKTMTFDDYFDALMLLKAKYRQQVNLSSIYNTALSAEIRRDPDVRGFYRQRYIDKQELIVYNR